MDWYYTLSICSWWYPPKKFSVECKVCCAPPTCLVVCHTKIIYVQSQSHVTSYACIHLRVHNHHVSIRVCHELLDMVFQFVTNEVSKKSTAKNSTIVIIVIKRFLAYYILKSPPPREKSRLHGVSLELVMDLSPHLTAWTSWHDLSIASVVWWKS